MSEPSRANAIVHGLFAEDPFIELWGVPFVFGRRPSPIPPDLRVIWRVPLVLLTLQMCCRQGRSSLPRLHVLNWAMRTPQSRRTLLSALQNERRLQDVVVRFEPTLNQAIEYGIGEGLLSVVKGPRVLISPRGIKLVDDLLAAEDIYLSERAFAAQIGKKVTEDWVAQMAFAQTQSLALA